MSTEEQRAVSEQTLLQKFYYQARLIQELEKRLLLAVPDSVSEYAADAMAGSGDAEVFDVGVLNAIDVGRDRVFSTCRARVHILIHGDDIGAYVARSALAAERRDGEASAQRAVNGVAGARQRERANRTVGEALNAALSLQQEDTETVIVVRLNECALGRRQLSHYFSVSSLWSLPVLYVLNGTTAPLEDCCVKMTNGASRGYVLPDGRALAVRSIVANDVLKIYAFACAAVSFVRARRRPFVLRLLADAPGESRCSDLEAASDRRDGAGIMGRMAQKLSPIAQQQIEGVVARRIETALQTALQQQAEPRQV